MTLPSARPSRFTAMVNMGNSDSHDSGTRPFSTETWGPAQFRLTTNGAIRRWYGAEMTYSFGIDYQADQAILKFTRDGTSLHTNWAPTGNSRQAFYNYVDQELAALEAMGHTWRITDMIWIQGEGDAKSAEAAEAYDERLFQFTTEIRSRYSSPTMRFKYNLAHQNLDRGYTSQLRQSQRDYLLLDPYSYMIDIDDLTLKSDSVHWTSETLQTAGFRFAAIPEPNLSFAFLMLSCGWTICGHRRFAADQGYRQSASFFSFARPVFLI